jgi:hypothetical protein
MPPVIAAACHRRRLHMDNRRAADGTPSDMIPRHGRSNQTQAACGKTQNLGKGARYAVSHAESGLFSSFPLDAWGLRCHK